MQQGPFDMRYKATNCTQRLQTNAVTFDTNVRTDVFFRLKDTINTTKSSSEDSVSQMNVLY